MKKKLRAFSWFVVICMTIFTQLCKAITPKRIYTDISVLSATFTHSNKIIATPPYGASPFDFGYINTTFTIYAGS
ncbi:MAG: hypothetical protein VB078_08515 [Clostridiaceae bacterium]|nr:hypothetical protein [Clostridiaceae bacterium]